MSEDRSKTRDDNRSRRLKRAPRSPNESRVSGGLGWRTRTSTWSRDALVAIVLGTIITGSALAIGTVHAHVLLVVFTLALVGVVVALDLPHGLTPRSLILGPLGVVVALGFYTALQLVPLPVALLARIAPSNADVWSRALMPFSEPGPTWASISLDPGASSVEVIKWSTYAAVMFMAAVVAKRQGPARVALITFVSGILVALVTVAHGLAGATSVYGFYTPSTGALPWHVGPFINPNNLAGYLNLATICGVAVLLSRKPLIPRFAIAVGIAAIVAVEVISASRGGILALPIGLVSLAVLLRLRRETGDRSSGPGSARGLLLVLSAALSTGAVLAVLGGTSQTWAELYDKNLSKVRMLSWAKPMILDHFWLGVGRGAFESVFQAYRTDPGNVVFTHPENFPAQWITEWGVPVALGAMVCLAWSLRPGMVATKTPTLSAMFIAACVLLLQNLFDLGVEVTGVAIALAATLGALWGGAGRGRAPASNGSSQMPSSIGRVRVGIAAAGMIVLGVAIGPLQALRDVTVDREELYRLSNVWMTNRSPEGRATLQDGLRKAILHHPAEPYFPLLVAELSWAARDENPLAGIGRSLERGSVNGPAHLLLARILTAQKLMPQARLELRMATRDDSQLIPAAAQLALRASSSAEELFETAADGGVGVSLLKAVAVMPDVGHELPLLREIARRAPSDPFSYERLAAIHIEEIRKGTGSFLCAGDLAAKCDEAVEQYAKVLQRLLPNASTADRFRASLLTARDQREQAEKLLANRCRNVDDALACLTARAHVAAGLKDINILHKVDQELLQVACRGSPQQCAESAMIVGDLFAARGEWGTALGHYGRSVKQEPTEALWSRIADAAARMGAHSQAADALEKVARLRGGGDEALRARIREERGSAMGQLFGP